MTPTVPGAGSQVPIRADLLAPFEAAYGAQLIGCTVVRIRGYLAVSNNNAAGTSFVLSRATIHVADQQEVTRPLTATDSSFDPASGQLDYMLFEPFLSLGSVPLQYNPSDIGVKRIDNKSSRKIDELNQALCLTFSSRFANLSADLPTLSYDLSIGVKLS